MSALSALLSTINPHLSTSPIPPWLQHKLSSPPPAGSGIHAWLFSVARQLHAHLSFDAAIAALTAATAKAGRRVTPREIRDAVKNSLVIAWRPKIGALANIASATDAHGPVPPPPPRWPKADPITSRCRIADATAEGVSGLSDLWDHSVIRPSFAADGWLDWLFPKAEWLCLARDHPATARTRPPARWFAGQAEQCGLVVPSPMTAPGGQGLDGRRSHRCLANTGPRRWLVIEFDGGSIDQQAALHWHLRSSAQAAHWPRLTLCVHSGGKSLHGWYGLCQAEDQTRELMAYAVSLGADPATWNRCQLVRLPGGRRHPPAGSSSSAISLRQEVFYFDPASCYLSNNSSAPGARPDSMPLPAPMEA